jgi:hypothetical protein
VAWCCERHDWRGQGRNARRRASRAARPWPQTARTAHPCRTCAARPTTPTRTG